MKPIENDVSVAGAPPPVSSGTLATSPGAEVFARSLVEAIARTARHVGAGAKGGKAGRPAASPAHRSDLPSQGEVDRKRALPTVDAAPRRSKSMRRPGQRGGESPETDPSLFAAAPLASPPPDPPVPAPEARTSKPPSAAVIDRPAGKTLPRAGTTREASPAESGQVKRGAEVDAGRVAEVASRSGHAGADAFELAPMTLKRAQRHPAPARDNPTAQAVTQPARLDIAFEGSKDGTASHQHDGDRAGAFARLETAENGARRSEGAEESAAPAPAPLPAVRDFDPLLANLGARVSLSPGEAQIAVDAGASGDLFLHLRVKDGRTDVRVDGPASHLVDSRVPELKAALSQEGLSLGSFQSGGSAGGGQAGGRSDHTSHEPAGVSPAPRTLGTPSAASPGVSDAETITPAGRGAAPRRRVHVTA